MLQKLNIKGFAESTITQLNVYSLKELCELDEETMARAIGPGNANNFILALRSLMANPIEDYRIIGALGFTNIAAKTWKIIFSEYTLEEFTKIITFDPDKVNIALRGLYGVGEVTVETILSEYNMFKEDIEYIMKNFNVINLMNVACGKEIRFSGCRDRILEEKLRLRGHDADGDAGVTKKTDLLIIPYDGFTSQKVEKALSQNCPIITLADMNADPDRYL